MTESVTTYSNHEHNQSADNKEFKNLIKDDNIIVITDNKHSMLLFNKLFNIYFHVLFI